VYEPTVDLSSPRAIHAALDRVARLFPDRDAMMYFSASGSCQFLEDTCFIAEKMQEVLFDDEEEEDSKKLT